MRKNPDCKACGDFRAVEREGWRKGMGQEEKEWGGGKGTARQGHRTFVPQTYVTWAIRPLPMSPESRSGQRTGGECRVWVKGGSSLITWVFGNILLGLKPLGMQWLRG